MEYGAWLGINTESRGTVTKYIVFHSFMRRDEREDVDRLMTDCSLVFSVLFPVESDITELLTCNISKTCLSYLTILIISYFYSSSGYDVINLLLNKALYYLLKGVAQAVEQCHKRIQTLEQTCIFLEKERAVNLDQLE